jgi:polyhydroxyalkanoate synthesis regulator phasin
MKARRDRTLESVSRRLLHLLNLPAGSDIRRLREQIARLERQVVALSKDLDDAGAR